MIGQATLKDRDLWRRVPAAWLALFNRPPRLNAAKVHINWLLSKEGQTVFAGAGGYVSARVDIVTDRTEPWRIPQPGAIETYTKAAEQAKDKLMPLLHEAFGDL